MLPESVRKEAGVSIGELEDSPLDVRLAAYDRLARIDGDAVLAYMVCSLRDREPAVQQKAFDVLSAKGNASIALRLERLLDDPEPRVRMAAVRLVARFSPPDRAYEKLAHLAKDKDEAVRSLVLETLVGDQRNLGGSSGSGWTDEDSARALKCLRAEGLNAIEIVRATKVEGNAPLDDEEARRWKSRVEQ
ncbi:MAG: HEAT repeat domain-containing protein [Elusimicrobia bacterium]|nr:HEAT repeat domain-containing protein [Elusimicrobiota bacterium]